MATDLGGLSFADWSDMGQPTVTVNQGGLSFGLPSLGSLGASVMSGSPGPALASMVNYTPTSYSIGGSGGPTFTPTGGGSGSGTSSFGFSGDGSGVTMGGGSGSAFDPSRLGGIGPDGTQYDVNGRPLFFVTDTPGQFRDIATGMPITQQQVQQILQGAGALTPAGTQATTGLFQKVPGGYIPYSPTGEAVAGQIFTTLPPGGVDVTELGITPGAFSAQNSLASAASRNIAPTGFNLRTPSGDFTATPTGSEFAPSGTFTAELARRTQAAADTSNFLLGEASKLDLSPLVDAQRKEFASQRERLGLARDRALSNINASAVRNRLTGSSFAQDAATRAEAEFAAQERALGAQEAQAVQAAKLQEIDARTQLRTRAFDVQQQAIQSTITDLLGASTLGAGLTQSFNTMFTALKSLEQTLAVQEAQSIRAAVFGERQSVRSTEAAQQAAEAQQESGIFQGLGRLVGSIATAPKGGFIDDLFKSIF